MKSLIFIFSLFLIVMNSFSQVKDTLPKFKVEDYELIKIGDTLMIELDEFSLLPKLKIKSADDARYYYWLRKKVYKAYPFAIIASRKLDSLNTELETLKRKRHKKRLVKNTQKFLEGEFSDRLKKLTRTEGRILIKLIHRQTGKTVFHNIKDLRSGWKAFWYNTTANIFKLSLKTEYHPNSVNEDYLVEDILQRAFVNEKLPVHQPKIPINFTSIANIKKGNIDVEEYKKMFAKLRKKAMKKKKQ